MDLNKVKAKIDQLNSSGGNDTVFKLQEGTTNIIRIVPYKYNKDWPFIELMFHYGVGKDKKTYLSPRSYDRPDPIAEMGDVLRREKDGWEKAKKFLPKLRTYVPVIVRGEEDKGVRFWSFGKTVFEEILGYVNDPEYGDISDPMKGTDLRVEYISAEDANQKYPKTVIRPSRKSSKLSEDKEELKSFLNNQPKIEDIFKEPTFEELEEVLEAWLNPDAASNEEEDEDPREKAKSRLRKSGSKKSETKKKKRTPAPVDDDEDEDDAPWDDDDTSDSDDSDDDDWEDEFDDAFEDDWDDED